MLNSNKVDKRIWVKGLSLECPLGDALEDCPMNALRHLMVNQLNNTINNLGDVQIDNIIHVHQHCLAERLNALEHSKQPEHSGGKKDFDLSERTSPIPKALVF